MTTMWVRRCTGTLARIATQDPRQAKFLTVDSLKWVLANKAYTPWYLVGITGC